MAPERPTFPMPPETQLRVVAGPRLFYPRLSRQYSRFRLFYSWMSFECDANRIVQ